MAKSLIAAPVPVPRLIPSVVNADPAVLARESTAHADAILRQGDRASTAQTAAATAQTSADDALAAAYVSFLNVATFGAKGDGVSPDGAAIQAALDAAEGHSAVVYLPHGTYMVSDTIFVPNKVVMTSTGRSGDGIAAAADFPTDGRPLVRLGRAADSLVFGCRVESMTLECSLKAKVGLYSTSANEQSGIRFCVVDGFTQYGIQFNGASIVTVDNVEVYPQAAGATTGIYLQSVAGDNLINRATIGVSGPLTNGLHVQSSQCIAQSIHVEDCTNGVNLDSSVASIIGVSGPSVTPNVTNLIAAQGNTRYNIALNIVKNSSANTVVDNFFGYTLTDQFLPLWIGGDSFSAGSLRGSRTRTAAPSSGTHVQGEIVYNSDPIASGFIGWVCVTAGSPGTWKSWGPISA